MSPGSLPGIQAGVLADRQLNQTHGRHRILTIENNQEKQRDSQSQNKEAEPRFATSTYHDSRKTV